ncbi:hypothetical protein U8335_25585 [Roseiconus lacunae]|uniref:Uncharacterized protein n=1 Tax=Roseiconus lacunae TaxID=2605694 RepID=A0ABT7PE10_9BACT|nr:hypothetical protein [Roseiconus lacunae]MCD0463714.1 hypothetical protein [Roseiconus lacunae]MDM4014721.1 hypothetical protein [Roseiconus lacunae]WRQ50311.1 hypothetical protein U8335_25585 [Stieleria sp. HD01]
MTQRRDGLLNWMLVVLGLSCLGCATVPSATPPAPPASAQAGGATIVAVAAPAPPAMTLPKFLGLDLVFGGVQKTTLCVRNRLGSRFPGLEPKPPIKSITDPANLEPGASPAVQAAAKAKAEEDQAPQKAKAIRYLASLGCGECYPDNEDALLAALEDCNEQIRYEVVRGLQDSIGGCCQSCKENSCCTTKLLQKLYQMAYERDESGCFMESSARIRRNARLVICKCGGVPGEVVENIPTEGPGAGLILGEDELHPNVGKSITVDENKQEPIDMMTAARAMAKQVQGLEFGQPISSHSIGSGVAPTPAASDRHAGRAPTGFQLPQEFNQAKPDPSSNTSRY